MTLLMCSPPLPKCYADLPQAQGNHSWPGAVPKPPKLCSKADLSSLEDGCVLDNAVTFMPTFLPSARAQD